MNRPHPQASDYPRVEEITAALCFAVPGDEPLINWPSEAGGRAERRQGEYREYDVTIRNARHGGSRHALDEQGFTLVDAPTRVTDFLSDAEITDRYEPEIASLLRDMTGAEKVVVFDHTRRAEDENRRREIRVREPVHMVHSDYTERSGPQKLRDFLPAAEAARRLSRRFAIVNTWRSMAGPVMQEPLALCESGSIDPADLIVIERRARDRIGEIFGLAHDSAQRWHYFPAMGADEVLLFKCFDSARDGRARMAPHTAFTDPLSPPGAAMRQSIESRCLLLF